MPPKPLIINVALTGMVPMPERAPHVPITADAVIADVERCAGLGASVFPLAAEPETAAGSPVREPDAVATTPAPAS